MVKVTYEICKKYLNEVVLDSNILLTNKRGGYFLDYKSTKYRGVFSPYKTDNGWSLYKSVDSISINSVPLLIKTNLYSFEKHYAKGVEKFFYFGNTILYEVEDYVGSSILNLDVRDIHDFDINGKKYDIKKENEYIIIKFTKNNVFQRFIVIRCDAPYEILNKWTSNNFEFDNKRGSLPDNWFVFESLMFKINGRAKISIATSDNKDEAIHECNYVYYSGIHLKERKEILLEKKLSKDFHDKKVFFAYNSSIKALDDLCVDIRGMKGIYAGLPWFFQVWTRDEAISLKALIKQKDYDFSKEVLLRSINNILPDGRISNRMPESELGSADGIGWVFKRFYELLLILKKEKLLDKYFSKEELIFVKTKTKESFDKLKQSYFHDGLFYNKRKETWMDTDEGNDPRDGARIEIQALHLTQLSFLKFLCKELNDKDYKVYDNFEYELKKSVKKHFFDGQILFDGKNDKTIRPNIFLAHYIYPELLKNSEWKTVFSNALKSLWLEWGGLSTIDKTHPLFCNEYTGMKNNSYHRGDSWFFINNLAAISMYRVDKKYFARFISKIIDADCEEILRLGAVGCCAEVSSAKEQRSEGTISQAWSSATFIELIDELSWK